MFRLRIFVTGLFFLSSQSFSLDLDPKAYIRWPLKTTTVFTGFAYSSGGVVTYPTYPIKNIQADVQSTSIGVSRVFNFFGLASQASVVVPYSWAQVSGDINQQAKSITRSGFADKRVRYKVLIHDAPTGNLEEIRKLPEEQSSE